jgi:hypothetical protein
VSPEKKACVETEILSPDRSPGVVQMQELGSDFRAGLPSWAQWLTVTGGSLSWSLEAAQACRAASENCQDGFALSIDF